MRPETLGFRRYLSDGVHIIPINCNGLGLDIKIAVAKNPWELQARRLAINRKLGACAVEEIAFNGKVVLLARSGLVLGPEKSQSPGSQALYLAKSEFKSPAVWIQGLVEGEQTSLHYHQIHRETYYLIDGQATLEVDGRLIDLINKFSVEPWQPHIVRSSSNGSIIAIVTSGSDNCFDMNDHHYLDSYAEFVKNHLPLKSSLI